MEMIIHRAASRGLEEHGWLSARHSFSFANYYNPERVNFGALRVLNDDVVKPGMGFGMHPHENMEIITIPITGALQHKDNMGNGSIIRAGEIQHMSAGTGIKHSEFNASNDEPINLLQIWLFPKEDNIKPTYGQVNFKDLLKADELIEVATPEVQEGAVQINQNAWFSLGKFSSKKSFTYTLKDKKNGVYVFIINGSIAINECDFSERDGLGITETDSIELTANSNAFVLLIEVPM